MDCKTENNAFTDRTGVTSALASDARLVQLAEVIDTAQEDASAGLDATMPFDPLDAIGTTDDVEIIAALPEGDLIVFDPDEDEGPLDALFEPEDNAEGDEGIPIEIINAPVDLAAAIEIVTGGGDDTDVAAVTTDPVVVGEGPVEDLEAVDEVEDEEADDSDDAIRETTDSEADGDVVTVAEATDGTIVDTSGLTPAEIAIALGADQEAGVEAQSGANDDGAGSKDGDAADDDPQDAGGDVPTDMGDGTAMDADMCPMVAAEMMMEAAPDENALTVDALMAGLTLDEMAGETDMADEDA